MTLQCTLQHGKFDQMELHPRSKRLPSPQAAKRTATGAGETRGGPKSTPTERRLVVPLLADRIARREDAVVYRARLSNQASPLELGLWNKSNDFTHVRLQNSGMLPLNDEYHSN